MTTFDQHRLAAAVKNILPDPALTVWQHAAFCRLALPVRATGERTWERRCDADSIGIEAGSIADPQVRDGWRDLPLPAGRLSRLLLIHLFTAALRAESTTAEIGGSIGDVASAIGAEQGAAKLRELREHLDRLLVARIGVAAGDARELVVFDARGAKPRVDAWRTSVRLNERFFTGLKQHAVALDREVLRALSDSVPALDAYAWLASELPRLAEGETRGVAWNELRQRFASSSQSASAFRAAFEASLESVRAAWWAASGVATDDNGVLLRRPERPAAGTSGAMPEAPAPAEEPIAEPAPEPAQPEPPQAEPAAERPADEPAAQEFEPTPPDEAAAEDEPQEPDSPDVEAEAFDEAELDTEEDEEEEPSDDLSDDERSLIAELESSVPPGAAPSLEPEPEPCEPQPMRAPDEVRGDNEERLGLMPHLTGLSLAVWLRRGGSSEGPMIEVTPPGRYDPARRSILAIEPIFLQVSGQLQPRELERIAAWATVNSDLIEAYWTGAIASGDDVRRSVRRVPASRW